MPNNTISEPTLLETAAHETLVSTLRNTHALEKQQIQVLDSHLELFSECPELHARVTQHLVETREQARRLEGALEACGASASMVKDTMMSMMGLGQSSIQSFGEDAEFKAVAADIMQEHLEVATYRMLISLAGMAGLSELRPRLMETLREEQAMAAWFDENIEAITKRLIEVKAQNQRADMAAEDASAKTASPTADSEQSETLWQQLENSDQSSAHPKPKPGNGADGPSATPASEPRNDSEAKTVPPGDTRRAD